MKILYADDDSDDRELFVQIIAEIDPEINVVQAADGIETLSLLAYGVLPDLIFLDINMPKLNGDETLKQIRKDPRLKDTKIVMYSTSIDGNTIQTYRSLNADFLNKPYTIQDGVYALRMVIQQTAVNSTF